MVDALDTLYIMELEEEFQEAKKWVEKSFDLNVVSQLLGMSVCVTETLRVWPVLITILSKNHFGRGTMKFEGEETTQLSGQTSVLIYPKFSLSAAQRSSQAENEMQCLMFVAFWSGL